MCCFGSFDEVKAKLRCVRSLIKVRLRCNLSVKDLYLQQESA